MKLIILAYWARLACEVVAIWLLGNRLRTRVVESDMSTDQSECKAWNGRPSDYQNEALQRYLYVTEEPLPLYSWVEATCETPSCLTIDHLNIRRPKSLNYAKGVCVYCGAPAGTKDHLIPRTWSGEAHRGLVLTVPACAECNSAIGDRYAPSITERRAIAQARIEKKYRHVLRYVDFTDEEMDEMGPGLRVTIAEGAIRKETIKDRLRWPPQGLDARAIESTGFDPIELGLLS